MNSSQKIYDQKNKSTKTALTEESRRLYESVSSPWGEFRKHPGQVARLKWDLLRDFYQDVVRVNGVKLIMLSELPQIDKKARKKLLREVLAGRGSEYNGEITRLLYNCLASAATLADHCRYVMKRYEGTGYHDEYRAKVEDFSGLPESAFLKDMRNYFAHYKIPSIGLSIGDVEFFDDEFRHEALIYTSDLDDSKKWSARSKQYIEDNFPHVYISSLVKVHLEGLADLYSWIFRNFERLHGDEYNQSLKVKEQIVKS